MHVKLRSFRAVLCLALFLGIEAEVKVENVVVSFSSGLPPENAEQLVKSMQDVLNKASSVLQTAAGLSFGDVTFHIPQSWNSSLFTDVQPLSSYNAETDASFIVDSITDSAFGTHPSSLQYGGCGVQGLKVSVPHQFLMTEGEDYEAYPKEKILAREWLKYRYGVFDENGFKNDPLYPTHYTIPGSDDIHITDCTSPKLDYSFRNSKGHECSLTSDETADCMIEPNRENVTSSLLFYHKKLTLMDHVCNKDTHNYESLNKQNLLCSYKSISEVIHATEDSKSGQSLSDDENVEIKYSFKQQSELRLFVAVQNNKKMLKQGGQIKQAVEKLMYDIPLQSKIAIYSFREDPSEVQQFFEISTEDDRKFTTRFPTYIFPEEAQPHKALEKAINVLQTDSGVKPGKIVIFADSNPEKNDALVTKLSDSNLCLVVITFNEAVEEAWNKYIEASECSSFWKLPDSDDKAVIFESIYKTFETTILPTRIGESEIQTVSTNLLTVERMVEIVQDPTAEMFTIWVFGVFEEGNMKCLVGDTEIKLDVLTKSSYLMSLSLKPQSDTIKCSLRHPNPDDMPQLVQVQMTTKQGEYFNNKAWTLDTTKGSKEQMPLIIYAMLYYGQYPVRDAKVEAEVTTPNGEQIILTLLDDGRGDPDITKNDGIYSKYFIQFNSTGTYKINITASDNSEAKASKKGQYPCCGSVIVGESFEVPKFQWSHEVEFTTEKKKPEKGYKPSRITDLRIDILNLPNSITLKWTAPGGEMDLGKASSYHFSMFNQPEDSGVLPNWVHFSNPRPKDYGKEETVTIHFRENRPENMTAYFSLKTMNNGKLSEESNRLYVKLALTPQQASTTPVAIKDKPKGSYAEGAGSIVAYVIITIALLMLLFGIIYFMLDRIKRKREMEDLNTPAVFANVDNKDSAFPFKSVSSEAENPIRRAESIPIVLYTHDQIKDFKGKTKQPPLYKSEAAPKAWASMNALIDANGSSSSSYSLRNIENAKTESSEFRPTNNTSFTTVPLHEKGNRY